MIGILSKYMYEPCHWSWQQEDISFQESRLNNPLVQINKHNTVLATNLSCFVCVLQIYQDIWTDKLLLQIDTYALQTSNQQSDGGYFLIISLEWQFYFW